MLQCGGLYFNSVHGLDQQHWKTLLNSNLHRSGGEKKLLFIVCTLE